MPEINLLPDNLRDREEKELSKNKKVAPEIKFSNPLAEPDPKPVKKKGGFFGFFSKEKKPKVKKEKPDVLRDEIAKKEVNTLPAIKPVRDVHEQSEKTNEKKLSENHSINNAKPVKPKMKKFLGFFPKSKKSDKNLDKNFEVNSVKAEAKPEISSKQTSSSSDLHMAEGGKNAQDDNLDINLIPGGLVQNIDLEYSRRLFFTVSGVIFSALIILVAYFGLVIYQYTINLQIKEVDEQILTLNQQAEALESNKSEMMELQKKLKLTRQLLDNHIYWSKFFEYLENYTTEEVYYNNFSMTGHDRLVISATGKDYESVAKQLLVFNEASDFIKSVTIEGAVANIDEENGQFEDVDFTVELEFTETAFKRQIE